MSKNWAEAERRYAEVLERYPNSQAAPEALYWEGVSHYKATNDHNVLGQLPEQFKQKYPGGILGAKVAGVDSLIGLCVPFMNFT